MELSALTKILLKIFSNGFYRVHAGMLLLLFFLMFGLCSPNEALNYHKALMLAFLNSGPAVTLTVFAVITAYIFKCWHYVSGQIFAANQQFLFYSSNAYTQRQQFISWFLVQVSIALPFLLYSGVCLFLAVKYHYFLHGIWILLYWVTILSVSAWFYMQLINKKVDGSNQSIILKLSRGWGKPYFSLFIYHVFYQLKLRYTITKGLSYLIITGVFLMFADVSHDIRVAGIALLAIAVSHSVIVFEERNFEETFLIFSRNLPYHRFKIFMSIIGAYVVLLIPEAAWLFVRFSPLMAVGLLAFCLSVLWLYHSLLYQLGLNMEKYLTRVGVLFMLLFWIIMFGMIWPLIVINLTAGYLLLYFKYYKTKPLIS